MSSSIEFTKAGPLAPDTDEVRAAILSDWQEAFNNLLNPDMATPQGQLITSETAIVQDKNNQILYLAQQFDPINAEGRFQDALASIYFIERHVARSTVIQCVCMGLEGVVIPGLDTSNDPAIIRDQNGNEFYCQTTTVIPASGTTTIPFAAVETGPLEVEARSVTTIVTVINGWDTVINPEAGIVGQNEESRRAFELRRQKSVALNSRAMLASVYSEVANIDGVLDVLARQNRSDKPKTEGGVTLAPHSVYIAVLGGSDAEIAEAIYNSVSGGCDYNGNVSYKYTDKATGAIETVKFTRPQEVILRINVNIRDNAELPANIIARVKANILADFYGEQYPNPNGMAHNAPTSRIGIGERVFASRFYCPAISAGASEVASITLRTNGGEETNMVELKYNQYLSLHTDNINVTLEY